MEYAKILKGDPVVNQSAAGSYFDPLMSGAITKIAKGDVEGHAFRGNQYTGSGSGASSKEARIGQLKDYIDLKKRVQAGGNALSTHERKELSAAQKELHTLEDKGPLGRLTKATPKQRQQMHEYMSGFTKNLTNSKEQAYCNARVKQMVAGEERPSGMSAQYGMTKQRAIQYEQLVYKIFQAGRAKHGV